MIDQPSKWDKNKSQGYPSQWKVPAHNGKNQNQPGKPMGERTRMLAMMVRAGGY